MSQTGKWENRSVVNQNNTRGWNGIPFFNAFLFLEQICTSNTKTVQTDKQVHGLRSININLTIHTHIYMNDHVYVHIYI